MTDSSLSGDRHDDPSRWGKRVPAVILALGGCAIATYLGLFQIGAIADVWEPFFGNGSRLILRESAIAQSLPVPDALLGALVYLAEAVSEYVGGRERWRTWPMAVLATGAIAAGLALAAIGLVAAQALWFHAYCTLCLASAACSLLIAGLVAPEVRAAWTHRNATSLTSHSA
jgi:hypothetical protein